MKEGTVPQVSILRSQSILSAAGGYIGEYDYTISPYVGCSFGCSYCYVPTLVHHRRLAPSWGYSLGVKESAPELMLKAAKKGRVTGKRIFLSPNTDPYVPQERTYQLTRRLLEVFVAFPPELLVVQTRSPLVIRDLDLLRRIRERVVVAMSITTDREGVRHLFEPRCSPILARVRALAEIHENGLRTQASLSPLLPCNPEALGGLVDGHCDWIVVQALKTEARALEHGYPPGRSSGKRGWEGWLQGGDEFRAAMQSLKLLLGPM